MGGIRLNKKTITKLKMIAEFVGDHIKSKYQNKINFFISKIIFISFPWIIYIYIYIIPLKLLKYIQNNLHHKCKGACLTTTT